MKVTKNIIGAGIGAAIGGVAGYFVGREMEKKEHKCETITTNTDTPIDIFENDTADIADIEETEEIEESKEEE